MSSLFRFPRRSHHDHLKDELKNEHLAPVQSPRHAPSITESVRERRLSALSFISEKLSHKPKLRWPRTSTLGIGDGGIGHTVDFPRTYSRESTPSPTGSLEDIQIPAGLGRRASESGLQPPDTPTQENIFLATPSNSDQRNRTRSAPSTTTSRTVKRKSVPLLSEMDGIRTDEPAISRMPPELLASVFSFATRRDVLSLTHVSKGFSTAALRALYCRLDLRALSPERVDRCVSLLASNRDFASYVRDFACAALPPPDAALPAVTFAIAFTNMHALESLTLPDYDARFLMHTSFRLKRLRVMSEFASEDDWRSFWAWLAKQPELASLSFPHLLQNASECGLPDPPPRPAHDDVDDDDDTDTLHEDTFAQSLRLPSNYLPRLAHFHGPASLAAAVVPGRPVVSVTLHVHTTLYDGLKPSAVMSALTRSRASVKRLGISVSLMQVDARTLERVFMSAGAELGSQLDTLAVEWVLDDEVLYKHLGAAIPRFRTLHTLRLRRRKVELPPRLAKALNAFPSPPESPLEPSSTPGPGPKAQPDIPPPRAQERGHLAGWAKQCPTLRRVLFLSGAEWRCGPGSRGGAYALPGERPAVPGFGFVGFVL